MLRSFAIGTGLVALIFTAMWLVLTMFGNRPDLTPFAGRVAIYLAALSMMAVLVSLWRRSP